MFRMTPLLRWLLVLLLTMQSFGVGAMEAASVREALRADTTARMADRADDSLPPCHRPTALAAKDNGGRDANGHAPGRGDCCDHGACRCMTTLLALPQMALVSSRTDLPVTAPTRSRPLRLPPARNERPLRPPSR